MPLLLIVHKLHWGGGRVGHCGEYCWLQKGELLAAGWEFLLKVCCKVVWGVSPGEQAAVTRHLRGPAPAGEGQASARDRGSGQDWEKKHVFCSSYVSPQASALTPASDRYDKRRVDAKLMEIRNELKVKICFDENTSQPLQSWCNGILINDINNQESWNLFQTNIIFASVRAFIPWYFTWKLVWK